MKNLIMVLSILLCSLFIGGKSHAFSHIKECVRWVLGGPVTAKLDAASTKEEKSKIMEEFNKKAPKDIAKKLEACQTLFAGNSSNTVDLKGPTPGTLPVCCSCSSASCISLWVLFGYCNTCEAQHSYTCCSSCNIPAASGQSCK